MNIYSVVSAQNFLVAFSLYCCLQYATAGKSKKSKQREKEPCEVCRNVVNTLNEGIKKTSKTKHYGGGDMAWEEAKLGAYENSELRFIEASESLCKVGDAKDEKLCHLMAEENEENIENWWFKYRSEQPDFFLWLCVTTLKECCPEKTFGKDCQPCQTADQDQLCSGNGKCNGDGTRGGTGKCKCNKGYSGDSCDICSTQYFEEIKNETHIICTACDSSCQECSGPGATGCVSCAGPGWEMDTEDGCVDLDECEDERSPCNVDSEYCVNTEGSFRCDPCSEQCAGCVGPTEAHCVACRDMYILHDGKCMTQEEAAASVTVTADPSNSTTESEGQSEPHVASQQSSTEHPEHTEHDDGEQQHDGGEQKQDGEQSHGEL